MPEKPPDVLIEKYLWISDPYHKFYPQYVKVIEEKGDELICITEYGERTTATRDQVRDELI